MEVTATPYKRLSVRLWIGFVSLSLVLAVCIFAWFQVERASAYRSQLAVAHQDRHHADSMIAVYEAQLNTFVDQWTMWDEFQKFARNPDAEFGDNQLDRPQDEYSLEHMWVFNEQGYLTYSRSLEPVNENRFEPVKIRDGIAVRLRKQTPVAKFFTERDGDVYEIVGAAIHGTRDAGRTGAKAGYFVIARKWSGPFLQKICEATNATMTIEKGDFANGSIALPLTDSNKTSRFHIIVRSKNKELLAALSERSKKAVMFLAIFLGAILSGMLAIQWSVVKPLAKVYRALSANDPDQADSLKHSHSEIAALAVAIGERHQQQLALDAMNEELHALNHELERANDEQYEANKRLVELTYSLDLDVKQRTDQLENAIEGTIAGWSQAMDKRDRETEGHTRRVAEMALRLGQAAGLDDEELRKLHYGALLHDIGKIGIPDEILHKPGKLTDAEFEIMKGHTTMAYEMLRGIPYIDECLDVPLYHHERWDGAGYPQSLKGEDIPFAARLFALADVWDALRSDRPYREAWDEAKTRAYIADQAGSHFDPELVDLFLSLAPVWHPSDEKFNNDFAA